MRNLHNTGVYKALLLAGCAGTFALATPVMAQQVGAEEEGEAEAAAAGGTIVVTGSRIQRPEFDSNSPMVSVDETFLEQSSTAAVEEQLNRLPQFVVSQSSTVKNNEGVLTAAGGDIQPNATNTPGAANVSLRGVGSNRTLVLIDGRRGVPGNANGAVDVSTIPSAALERVEIISGGASATYGADAVAGVTNFILKKDFQGIELDAQMGISQYGDGFEYQIGGIMGSDFDDGRGNVSMAMSVNTREPVFQRDRPAYRDIWADPSTTSGAFFFVPRPGVNLTGLQPNTTSAFAPIACGTAVVGSQPCVLTNSFPGANPAVPNNTGTVYFNQDGSLFTTGFAGRGGGAAFYKPWEGRDQAIGSQAGLTSVGTLKFINALTPLTVPTDRYNFLARGNYEVNDWIGVFAQAMFSNNTTYTVQEPGPLTSGWDVFIPWGSGQYTGQYVAPSGVQYTNPAVPSSVIRPGDIFNGVAYVDATPTLADNPTNPAFRTRYGGTLACANAALGGCTNTQVFQGVVPDNLETLLNTRSTPNAPFKLQGFLPLPRETFSEVITYQMLAGLEGSIPGTDFTWEAFVNHGISTTLSRQTGMYSLERLRAVFSSPNMGQGFRAQGNQASGNAGFGASTGECTTGMRYFQGYEGISQNCTEAITADVSNKSQTTQTIAEMNLQGGLFELPAGQLRFALGASYRENRYEFSNETLSTAGRSFTDQVVGIYPSTNMPKAGIDVKEFYGELLIPVLADIPFIQSFNLEIGGRMSNYNTTGTSFTFKALGDWEVTDWLRLRGGFNRAERAPNIAELLLTPQQAFRTDAIGDLCSTRHFSTSSANPANNSGGAAGAADVMAICQELIARDNGGVFVDPSNQFSFYDPLNITTRQPVGGGFAFSYAVGNQYYRDVLNPSTPALKPEVADTWTAGAVIRSPFSGGALSRLNLTVDYFNINIKDPIGTISAGGLLLRCVDPAYNAAAAGAAASRAAAQAAIAQSTCPSIFRNPSTDFFNTGQLNSARIFGTYGNEGGVKLSGVDVNLSWGLDAGPGSIFMNINANYMIDFKVKELDTSPWVDYVGTTGTGTKGLNSGASFEYKIFANLGYSWGPATVSLQWQHTPKTEDGAEAQFLNGLAAVGTDQSGLPAYNLFHLNGSYELNESVRIRFGVDNLFNKKPPQTNIDVNVDPALGQLPGGSYSLFHDVQGRRFSLGGTVRF